MSTRSTLVAFALVTAGCGGSGSPTGPGTPPPAGGSPGSQSCRQLPSAYTTEYPTGQGTQVINATCSFDASSVRLTCIEQGSGPAGSGTFVAVATWPSRGDIVDEISVLPPVRRGTTTTVTQTAGGTFSSTISYSYDGQKRLVQEVDTGPAGTFTTTYTSWDAAGRPTAGTRVGPPSGSIALAWSYDAGARSTTVTPMPGAGPCTYFHNENGVVIRIVCAATDVARTTIQSTFSVCR